MKITSGAFSEGQRIPEQYTCDGENVSPSLSISDILDGTESLVLIVDDIDAPGGVFDHWIVFDLPVVSEIKSGEEPGVNGRNSFGKTGYGGPCPPRGEHRYYFRIFALDKKLGLIGGISRREVEGAMKGHVLGSAELMGRYAR